MVTFLVLQAGQLFLFLAPGVLQSPYESRLLYRSLAVCMALLGQRVRQGTKLDWGGILKAGRGKPMNYKSWTAVWERGWQEEAGGERKAPRWLSHEPRVAHSRLSLQVSKRQGFLRAPVLILGVPSWGSGQARHWMQSCLLSQQLKTALVASLRRLYFSLGLEYHRLWSSER